MNIIEKIYKTALELANPLKVSCHTKYNNATYGYGHGYTNGYASAWKDVVKTIDEEIHNTKIEEFDKIIQNLKNINYDGVNSNKMERWCYISEFLGKNPSECVKILEYVRGLITNNG